MNKANKRLWYEISKEHPLIFKDFTEFLGLYDVSVAVGPITNQISFIKMKTSVFGPISNVISDLELKFLVNLFNVATDGKIQRIIKKMEKIIELQQN